MRRVLLQIKRRHPAGRICIRPLVMPGSLPACISVGLCYNSYKVAILFLFQLVLQRNVVKEGFMKAEKSSEWQEEWGVLLWFFIHLSIEY